MGCQRKISESTQRRETLIVVGLGSRWAVFTRLTSQSVVDHRPGPVRPRSPGESHPEPGDTRQPRARAPRWTLHVLLPRWNTEKPVKWLGKSKSDILQTGAKAIASGFTLHLSENLSDLGGKAHTWDGWVRGQGSGMHTQTKVALGSPPTPRQGQPPRASHPHQHPAAGASPAGLSAAIFLPQFRFFPQVAWPRLQLPSRLRSWASENQSTPAPDPRFRPRSGQAAR